MKMNTTAPRSGYSPFYLPQTPFQEYIAVIQVEGINPMQRLPVQSRFHFDRVTGTRMRLSEVRGRNEPA